MQKKKYQSLFPYRRGIRQILVYQIFSKGIFSLAMFFYKELTGLLMWSVNRPAFTSGDLPYLLRTWQGWCLVVLGFVALVIYTVFDIHAMLLLSKRLLKGEKIKVIPVLKEGLARTRNLRGPLGVLAILYVSLAAPLVGLTLGISLTANFVIPDFIVSFIRANKILYLLYILALCVLAVIGLIHLFTFHFVVLGNQPVRQAMKNSRLMIRENWKGILPNYLLFILKSLLGEVGALLIYLLLSIAIRALIKDTNLYHTGILLISMLFCIELALFAIIFQYFCMLKLTVYYVEYVSPNFTYCLPAKVSMVLPYFVGGFLFLCLLGISASIAPDFEEIFPPVGNASIVAHRGGGNLSNENTVLSLEEAINYNVYGSEIDIQRTADNHYILNHDNDFQRCCNDPRTPGEMTLEEIKELRVINAMDPDAPTTEVATLEEILDAAKDRIHLFIELKGVSADEQMVKDVYQMVTERDMLSQVSFISLEYGLIDYIEKNYPEVDTGYLCYFSFGNLSSMDCDTVLMEAEVATSNNVAQIHDQGKKAGVWTVNTFNSMTDFMTSDLDYIITDEVAQTYLVQKVLYERSDEARVIARLLHL